MPRQGWGHKGLSTCPPCCLIVLPPTHPSTVPGNETEMGASFSFLDAGPRLYFSFLTLVAISSLTIPKLPGQGAFGRVVISRPAFQQDRVRYQDRAGHLACLHVSLPSERACLSPCPSPALTGSRQGWLWIKSPS